MPNLRRPDARSQRATSPVSPPAAPSPPAGDEVSRDATDDGALDQVDEPVEATAEGPRCPHCGEHLVAHDADEGPKRNAWHCDACGGCWVHRGSAWFLRDGHPPPLGWEE